MHKTPSLAGAALVVTLFGLAPAWATKPAAKEPVVEVALSEAGANPIPQQSGPLSQHLAVDREVSLRLKSKSQSKP